MTLSNKNILEKQKFQWEHLSITIEENKMLLDYINAFNHYYHHTALITDNEFDNLEDILMNNPIIAEYIIQEKTRLFNINKSLNNHIAVSLDKIKEKDFQIISQGLTGWCLKHKIDYRKLISNDNFFIAPKFDGGALKIELNYNQEIIKIITRGGVDYTEKLKNNNSIIKFHENLKKRNLKMSLITGEMVIKKSVFMKKYSENRDDLDFGHLPLLKNPRNAINSLIASDDPNIYNDLDFVPLTDGTNPFSSIWQNLDLDGLFTLKNVYQHWKENLDYLIDGIVIGFNVKKRIVKNNYPLNMVAIKFKAEAKPTNVIDIEWSQKKTGKLNPVLVLEPIMLDGTEIKRVTIYNYDQLVNVYKCGVGSTITIRKGDEITPKIEETLKESLDFKIPPKTKVDGKYLFYLDDSGESNLYKQKFILGLSQLNIEGIGPKLSEKIGPIYDWKIVNVFNKELELDLASVLNPASANFNKIKQIYDIKNLPLNVVISMLQFNGCGQVLSLKFAEMLTKIKPFDKSGIDDKVFESITNKDGEFNIKLKSTLETLKEFGVKVIKPIQANDDAISFEMTGNPHDGITKNKFKELLKVKYPNSIHTTLTKNTKYLIVDDLSSTSSKSNKARRYNIKIVTYKDVLDNGF